MSKSGKDGLRLGFLSAIEVTGKGFVGGLLVTTQHGRPLEFQCTTPVRPNPTQKILYGPTLQSYLLGELIGQTLIQRAQVKPQLVLVDDSDMLELRPHVQIPVALCKDDDRSDVDAFLIGRQALSFHPAALSDRSEVQSMKRWFTQDVDLLEPFDRVRDALTETVRAAA
jgi:hypothetical protein